MNKLIIYSAAFTLFVAMSCKENEDTNTPNALPLVKSISIDWAEPGPTEEYKFMYEGDLLSKVEMTRQFTSMTDSSIYSLNYNSENELEGYQVKTGQNSIADYTGKIYSSETQITIVKRNDSTCYNLNSNKKPSEYLHYQNVPANTPQNERSNYLLFSETLEYLNNNINTSNWYEYQNGKKSDAITYTYTYGNIKSPFQIPTNISLFLIEEFGYHFKMWLLSENNILTGNETGNEKTNTLTYKYIFNDKGQPEKIDEVEETGEISASITITYY